MRPGAGRTRTYTVSRTKDCDIRVPSTAKDGSVSRVHCLVDLRLPHIRVRDGGSHNGTCVNGVQLEPHPGPLIWEENLNGMMGLSHATAEVRDAGLLRLGLVGFRTCLTAAGDNKGFLTLLLDRSTTAPAGCRRKVALAGHAQAEADAGDVPREG